MAKLHVFNVFNIRNSFQSSHVSATGYATWSHIDVSILPALLLEGTQSAGAHAH